MAELDLETVLDGWFRREIGRAHALFAGNDYAAAIRPAGLDEIEARKFDRSVMLGDAESNLERLRAELDAGVFSAGHPTARGIAPRVTPSLSESTPEFTALCRRVTELLGEVEEARARWAGGDVGYRPSPILSTARDMGGAALRPTAPTPSPSATTADDAGSPLRVAIERRIAKYRRDHGPTDRLLRQMASELELLVSAFGGDTRVDSVAPAMMRRLCDAIQYLPPQWRSNKALGRGNVFERAAIAQGMDLPRLNKLTVKGHMSQWRILFDDEGASPNAVTGIVIRVPRIFGAKPDRGYSAEEIDQIFNSPLFQGANSIDLPYQHGKTLIDNWQFWACLIVCFTGARISENPSGKFCIMLRALVPVSAA